MVVLLKVILVMRALNAVLHVAWYYCRASRIRIFQSCISFWDEAQTATWSCGLNITLYYGSYPLPLTVPHLMNCCQRQTPHLISRHRNSAFIGSYVELCLRFDAVRIFQEVKMGWIVDETACVAGVLKKLVCDHASWNRAQTIVCIQAWGKMMCSSVCLTVKLLLSLPKLERVASFCSQQCIIFSLNTPQLFYFMYIFIGVDSAVVCSFYRFAT